MLVEYLLNISFWELLLTSIILFNFFKIFSSTNITFILGYFFFFILFNGLYFILLECDLPIIILWIVYFGVILIFLLFLFMWNENTFIQKLNFFYIIVLGVSLIFFFNFINLKYNSITLQTIDFYNLLNSDNLEELELLGLSFLYYNFCYFLMSTYILLINCLIVVSFFLLIKLTLFLKNTQLVVTLSNKMNFHWLIYKNQTFFLQDEENTFQSFSILKNYKVSHKLHKLKSWKRRV